MGHIRKTLTTFGLIVDTADNSETTEIYGESQEISNASHLVFNSSGRRFIMAEE